MHEAGVIIANVAVVDPTQIGRGITIFVEVEIGSAASPPHPKSSSATMSPEARISSW
jgi:hypothetical protein